MKMAYLNNRGQAATELAIYGAILIFVIGGIVSAAFSSSRQQNQQLKSMRQAMLKSWQAAKVQLTNRNSASTLYIEDNVSPDLNKYGPSDRVPNIMSGSGTFSNQLMQPIDWPNTPTDVDNTVPVMDVVINGVPFQFRMAGFTVYKYVDSGEIGIQSCTTISKIRHCTIRLPASQMTPSTSLPLFYQMVVSENEGGALTNQQSFDLNRNGNYSDDPPISAWKWSVKPADEVEKLVDPKKQQFPSFDVDGDGQEEVVYGIGKGSKYGVDTVMVLDYQQGDLDFSTEHVKTTGRTPGLQNDMSIYTPTGSPQRGYLQVKEGKAFNPETGNFVRSVSFNDQASVIERQIQLTADTGNMCNGTDPVPPVEACGNCFATGNVGRTCFDKDSYMLYVRSSISDKRGRAWKTDIGP
jgi:hypothetical protein